MSATIKLKSENDAQNSKRIRLESSACSVSSLDDSGLSISETSSGTSSPEAARGDSEDLIKYNDNERSAGHHLPHHEILMQQYNQNLHNMLNPTSWMDLMFPYIARNPYHPHHPQHHMQVFNSYDMQTTYAHAMARPPYLSPCSSSSASVCKESPNPDAVIQSQQTPSHTPEKSIDLSTKPTSNNNNNNNKKCSFTISAILGYDN